MNSYKGTFPIPQNVNCVTVTGIFVPFTPSGAICQVMNGDGTLSITARAKWKSLTNGGFIATFDANTDAADYKLSFELFP